MEKRNLVENETDNMYLYQYGVECDYFIIILDGSAVVQIGKDGMEVNAGLFSYYGVNALCDETENDPLKAIANDSVRKSYKPELSLKVASYCVYLQINRKDWKDAVKKTIIERTWSGVSPSSNQSSHLNNTITTGSSSALGVEHTL